MVNKSGIQQREVILKSGKYRTEKYNKHTSYWIDPIGGNVSR